jgi:cation:H+ antiporter
LGAEWLVRGSAGLARAFGVKPLIVGLTVVAYGTSAPELAVSSAAILGTPPAPGFVLGNVFGSCIANLALILGITALISPPSVDGRLIRREVPVLLLSAAFAPLVLLDGAVVAWESAIMLSCALAFTAYTLMVSAKDHSLDDSVDGINEEIEDTGDSRGKLMFITVVGLALLIGGSEIFIRGARGMAQLFGMSEALIGATILAFGTSLPELAASIVAAMRGYSSLAVGNVVGSNIFNVFLILGAVGLIKPVEGSVGAYSSQLIFLGIVTLLAVFFMRGTRRISRIEGALLTCTYAGFIGVLVFDAIR